MVGDVCWIWSAMMVGSDEFLGYPFSPGIIAGVAFGGGLCSRWPWVPAFAGMTGDCWDGSRLLG